MPDKPQILVSIGVPVFNGEKGLARALDSLLVQDYPDLEIIVSDNASTDGTRAICEKYVNKDSRIKYHRVSENRGAIWNFNRVFELSSGKYFMWAAHDDLWSANYVEAMANRLDESPEAVLATPLTHIRKVSTTGASKNVVLPESPASDRWAILDEFFLVDFSCVWFYGLYRTDWLKKLAPELNRHQIGGADRLWLLELILNHGVVGTHDAVFYYTCVDGKPKDRSSRTKLRALGIEIYHMFRLALQMPAASDRMKAVRRVLWFLYWHRISRRNPIGTMVRIMKLSFMGAWLGLESGIRHFDRKSREVSVS